MMMETIEYRTIDKTDWERGPWDDEPDKIQFPDDATGLPCLIVRGPHGALCGYVGVPNGHRWHGVDYDNCKKFDVPEGEFDADAYIDVHGGLTYASFCSENKHGICHLPGAGEPDDVWWLGFDCAHCNDKSDMAYPAHIRERRTWSRDDIYRDVAYVKSQCALLAQQIAHA